MTPIETAVLAALKDEYRAVNVARDVALTGEPCAETTQVILSTGAQLRTVARIVGAVIGQLPKSEHGAVYNAVYLP